MTKAEIIAAILDCGLFVDGRGNLYGDAYAGYLRPDDGLWQHPEELADLLFFLQDKGIKSFLNVGTFNGRTFNVIADVLRPAKCVSIDPEDHHPVKKPGYSYLAETTDGFAGQEFDFVFIDGHHSYEWAKRDYDNVGRHAKYCAFHDIDDEFIRRDLGGGICRLWDELKAEEEHLEFVAPGKPCRVMGIGLLT